MLNENKIKQYSTKLLLILGLCFSFTGNALNELKSTATTITTSHYQVSYKSRVQPLPLNRIHSWVLHIESLEGEPVEKAKISIYGGMPAHKHGLPTQPQVKEIGGGDYLVEGLKFSMNGGWEIWFNIRLNNVVDKVKFNINF